MEHRRYEIVNQNSEYLFLRDISNNTYCKVDYTYSDEHWQAWSIHEDKPFFNYILVDDKPDTVIFGVPFKNGSRASTSTADKFPTILRQASYKLLHPNQYPDSIPLNLFHLDTSKLIECGKIMDVGNVTMNGNLSERESISQVTSYCVKNSLPFICVGGDHSYTFDVVASLELLNKPIVLWVLDAHNDLYGNESHLDHGNVFSHIANLPFIKAIVQVGSRGYRTVGQIVEHPKVIQIPKAQFSSELMKHWLQEFSDYANYISIDLDCLDPQLFPYVDFGVPGGFSRAELLSIVDMIFNENGQVVGVDIVEGTEGGSVMKGDYDIPLEILLSILNQFFIHPKKEGLYKSDYSRKGIEF
ncbi:arginase family protein [Priestia taiwanensis]|uniref:Agmatinase n=1 Tax=Priestia taiwanensis TaxID=1347902 RepID=A0A917ARE2_9BACI|nr:arginase family protein [Priestia taiwanensis]MBM7363858.1 agmatinase [Priestia taiwanensis]GGE69561.1 hypothetical protein GCM10007140_19520 [Priestia taiwanensis]